MMSLVEEITQNINAKRKIKAGEARFRVMVDGFKIADIIVNRSYVKTPAGRKGVEVILDNFYLISPGSVKLEAA